MAYFRGQRYCEPHNSVLCECDLYEEVTKCEECGAEIVDATQFCAPCGIADSKELLQD